MNESTLLLLGNAVYTAQKLEFAMYGLVAQGYHMPHIKRDKRFQDLTPSDFLSADPDKRKLRKATLGQVIKGFSDIALFSMKELESIVERRNTIIHEFWRRLEVEDEIKDPDRFLEQFIYDCEEWISILRGFLSHIVESGMKNLGRESEFILTEDDLINRAKFEFVVNQWLLEDEE